MTVDGLADGHVVEPVDGRACGSAGGSLEPFELDVGGRRIAGLRTRTAPSTSPAPRARTAAPAPLRLLCLHGWLDDAASFVPLADALAGTSSGSGPDVELVAIDLPGHGHSDHAPDGYTLFDMALAARRTLDALGWERCHVVGHSLGANVAPWLAVAAPASVASLVLVEGVGPYSEEAAALPERLHRAVADRLDGARFAPRTFPDLEAAVDHRLKHAPMERASARLVMARQTRPANGAGEAVTWRFDPALRHASAEYRTEAQVLAVLGAIACPALAILAGDGYPLRRAETDERLRAIPNVRTVRLPGRHHLHMDDPAPVARAVREFLAALPAGGAPRARD